MYMALKELSHFLYSLSLCPNPLIADNKLIPHSQLLDKLSAAIDAFFLLLDPQYWTFLGEI